MGESTTNPKDDPWATGQTREYLVEFYLPHGAPEGVEGVALRARMAVKQLSGEGVAIRYLGSIFVPAEDVCFQLFEAGLREELDEVARRADLRFDRVLEAVRPAADSLE